MLASSSECRNRLKDVKENDIDLPKDVFDRKPVELVDIALSSLQAAGIQLIEWGALLHGRMSVPLVITDFGYVVPDEDLPRASEILSNIGLPLFPHTMLHTTVEGDLHTKGTYHRLTRYSNLSCVRCFVLFPASFVSLTPEELYTAPSIHLAPKSSITKVLVPRPSAVFAWILRTLLKYPRGSPVRTNLAADLEQLVDYHLLQVMEGYVNPDENPELWQTLDIPKRIADARHLISQWTENREWRQGEEWFGETLRDIVSDEGNIDHFPSASSPRQ